MCEAIGLAAVIEQHVVGIGDERRPSPSPLEDPATHQNDAVRQIGFFRPFRLDARATAEIHDGDARRFKEQAPRVQ
jgi:hypothetical protein